MRKASKAPGTPPRTQTNHSRWFVTGLSTSAVWMSVGCVITLIQGDNVRSFVRDWINYQGPFLIWLGTWLLLMIRSKSFSARVSALTCDGSVKLSIVGTRLFRFLLVGAVTSLTFVSGIRMGFYGQGAVRLFLWFTYFCIEIATGLVTLHALEILVVVRNLQHQKLALSHYAPANTPELRSVVTYFSAYVFLIAVGQVLGLLGTLKGHWTGAQQNVEVFRWFWSLVYFPMSSVLLIYSHWVVHKLIQKEKEHTVSTYRQELEEHLSRHDPNTRDSQIERTNHLAELVDRITASPNYVVDFGIAARTLLPFAVNLLTLFVKARAS